MKSGRKPYDHAKIEKKWQKYWESKKIFNAKDPGKGVGKKFYSLIEFPYPSGDGLHVGHIRSNTAMDVISRKRRMEGHNVLYPIGWDAFGLPTENYAIKTGIQPAVVTKKNTGIFRRQLKSLGFSFDWSTEIYTSDPKYYKWTQWIFLQFLKKGLAYKKKMAINWCPKDLIGLANEEVVDGRCERCGTPVEKREKEQWMLAITKYAERLDKDLDLVDYLERIKIQQRNWIGKSEGAEIDFKLKFDSSTPKRAVLLHGYTATPNDDFHPWLKNELEKHGYEVEVPKLPNTRHPTEAEQVEYVLKNVVFDENTILLGHSLGSVVALKVLEKLDIKIAGLVTVGGFIDTKFKDHDRNFDKTFTWNFNFKKIKSNTGFIRVLHDVNDVAITDAQSERLANALGVSVEVSVANDSHFTADKEPKVLEAFIPSLKVFTTRPDTIFGATYMVLSPEHLWVTLATDDNHIGVLKNRDEVIKYITEVKKKTDIERTSIDKEKTGVELKGVKAVNPATHEEIPLWIADFVLADYGTGAVMAVPAHDERDFQFAKKYGLPVKRVVEPCFVSDKGGDAVRKELPFVERKAILAIVKHWSEDKYIGLKWKKADWQTFITGAPEGNQTMEEGARTEIIEETGYKNPKLIKPLFTVHAKFFHIPKNINRFAHLHAYYFELQDGERNEISKEEQENHEVMWLSPEEMDKFIGPESQKFAWKEFRNGLGVVTEPGILAESGSFSSLPSEESKKSITESVGGKWVTKFKLRDWVFSRQRYWGEPIPVVHCDRCGIVPLSEKDLPLKLPKVKNYKPTETGESPLAAISKWVNTKCPNCKGKARRETDTMPNWAGSSWYYLRYVDPKNKRVFADRKKLDYWTPVDWYNGGMEHTTLHLLYSRFWHKFLFDQGLVPTKEPYQKRTSHGLILAKGGEKMSKSKGNVVNPDSIIKAVGADALRIYEMFMGPFDQHIAWDENGIVGTRRFIEKVWKLREQVHAGESASEILIHRTIKKVSEDIESMKFNTAISSLMILTNELEKESQISREHYQILLKLLSPFAPHVAEELSLSLGNKKSILLSAWPAFDPEKIVESSARIIVQVNGKMRGSFDIASETPEEEVKNRALNLPEVKKWTEGKEIKKVIIVKEKLVNIVL